MITVNTMGRSIVLTYKRKRLLSRSGNPGLPSDAPSALLESKFQTNNICNHEKPRSKLTKNDAEFGIVYDSLKFKFGEDVPRCEDQNSHRPVECPKDSDEGRVVSSCAKICHASVGNCTKESSATIQEKGSSVVTKSVFYRDVNIKEIHNEKSEIHSSDKSVEDLREKESSVAKLDLSSSVRIGSQCDNQAEIKISALASFGAVYDNTTHTITSDEINCSHDKKSTALAESDSENPSNCSVDDSSCLHSSAVTKPRFGPSLITFSRRSKRKLEVNASPPAEVACQLEPTKPAVVKENITDSAISFAGTDGKQDKLEDLDRSCSLHAPKSAFSVDLQHDDALHRAHGVAEDNLSSDSPHFLEASPLHGKACIDINENQHSDALDMKCQSISCEDVNTSRIASDADTKIHNSCALQLMAPACRDIDCNMPLHPDSDEKDLSVGLEVPHCPSDSLNKTYGDISMSQLHLPENSYSVSAIHDKGKRPVDPCQLSKFKSLELFPEHQGSETISTAPEKRWYYPTAGTRLPFASVPFGNDASCPSFLGLPNGVPLSRSSHGMHPLSRENALFANDGSSGTIAVNSSSLDRFSSRTPWLDEELDSLWIGVRRHGRHNFESILSDPRLHFLPWRTPRDLADRWQEEQQKLLQSTYPSPQELSKANSLLDQLSMAIQKGRQLQKPVKNFSSPWNSVKPCSQLEFSAATHSDDRSLPHWLKQAAEMKESTLVASPVLGIGSSVSHYGHWMNQDNFVTPGKAPPPFPTLWPNSRYKAGSLQSNAGIVTFTSPSSAGQRRNEPDESVVGNQDDMILVRSDASSEETISDDRNAGS